MNSLRAFLLGGCMFLSGYCGIVAELCLFTLAESLIGSTLTNLLYTMGVMMFFMGVGSWFMSKSFTSKWGYGGFIGLELTLSLAVCTSIPSLTFLSGTYPHLSTFFFIFSSALIGFLIGMEIPLMQKLLQQLTGQDIQTIAGKIMMADYFGSLVGFGLFTMILLFKWGLPWTAYSSGWLNGIIALVVVLIHFGWNKPRSWSIAIPFTSLLLWIGSDLDLAMEKAEKNLYRNPILLQEQTPYQKLTLTAPNGGTNPHYERAQNKKQNALQPILEQENLSGNTYTIRKLKRDDIAFYINGGLQFHSSDEFIYHEHLTHPVMISQPQAKKVLLMGAGDGLALREVVKYPSLTHITLVELDPAVVTLFKENPRLKKLNQNAYQDPRLKVVFQDAWAWARESTEQYDVIILDFPDPHHIETAKLYSLQFYKLIQLRLTPTGSLITQATSPLYSPTSFICIKKTLEEANFKTLSFHIELPSFAQWGFHLASPSLKPEQIKNQIYAQLSQLPQTRHFERGALETSWSWPRHFWTDYQKIKANDFYNYALLHYYQAHK